MSRGQKRHNLYGTGFGGDRGDYYDEFGGGGRGFYSRGRGRKQQPRICYVNAEFLTQQQQQALDFQGSLPANGIRRRGGCSWGQPVIGGELHNRIGVDDHSEESRDVVTNGRGISVTVPMNRRLGDGGRVDYGVSSRVTRPRSRGRDRDDERSKRRRTQDYERSHRDHKRPRRYHKRGNGEDSVEVGTSGSEIELEDDEDLRYTLVRQKIVRNKLRREPGEIIDTDDNDSTPASSPKNGNEKPKDNKSATAVTVTSSSSKKHSRTGCVKEFEGTGAVDVDSIETNSRPITVESLSQGSLDISADDKVLSAQAANRKLESLGNERDAATIILPVSIPLSRNGANEDEGTDEGELGELSQESINQLHREGAEGEDCRPISAESASNCSGRLIINEGERENADRANLKTSTPNTSRPASAKDSVGPGIQRSQPPPLSPISPGDIIVDTEKIESSQPCLNSLLEEVKRLKVELFLSRTTVKERDIAIADYKRQLKGAEEKDIKIRILRGKKTQMENDMEMMKKQLKDLDLKSKKLEQELKSKQAEESLKRPAEAENDPNKPDVQLIFAMAYQDRLFVEVERIKSSFEIEVLKLQEYYEARLSHYRNQGCNPGPFMGMPVTSVSGGGTFPKGCVVTPMNNGQSGSAGSQDQPANQQRLCPSADHIRHLSMGIFSHLGNPELVNPPILVPTGFAPRARLPMFFNPIRRGQSMDSAQFVRNSQQIANSTTITHVNNVPNTGNLNSCNSNMGNNNPSFER